MANGQPELATCRKALQQMEEHGVIWLPLPPQESRGIPPEATWIAASDPQELLTGLRKEALHKVVIFGSRALERNRNEVS